MSYVAVPIRKIEGGGVISKRIYVPDYLPNGKGSLEDLERCREEMTEDEMMRKYAEANGITDYPQAHEPNEYRYLSPAWLDEIAKGLTAGQEKYPGETWRKIPAREHAWRAVRHLVLYLKSDKADTHLINAAMRCMMAFETDAAANDVIEWEKLMREKGCG